MSKNRNIVAASIIAAGLVLSSAGGAAAALIITGANVKDGTLTGADVKNGSLTGSDIKDSSLGGGDVVNGSLSGADIKDGSLSASDLSSSARSSLRGATGPQGPAGSTGAAGEQGPAGPPGTTFHVYTGTADRTFSTAPGLPADPPADPTTWTLVLGTTAPANTYEEFTVTLLTPYNFNNPDGLHCAVLFDGSVVANGAHRQDATSPWTYTDVADGFGVGNGQVANGADYQGIVSAPAATYGATEVEVRCFKAAGVSTSVQATVTAKVPLTKTLSVTSDPQ